MYEIVLTREAQKDYQKLAKSVTGQVNQCFDSLGENPLRYPQAIPLKGKLAGFYRWRVGRLAGSLRGEYGQANRYHLANCSQK